MEPQVGVCPKKSKYKAEQKYRFVQTFYDLSGRFARSKRRTYYLHIRIRHNAHTSNSCAICMTGLISAMQEARNRRKQEIRDISNELKIVQKGVPLII